MTTKVFRVIIGESQGFHVDIEALDSSEAMKLVRSRLADGAVQPIEDSSYCTGYEVEDAVEISREDSDLTE